MTRSEKARRRLLTGKHSQNSMRIVRLMWIAYGIPFDERVAKSFINYCDRKVKVP